jgi:aspartate/methionine/tyrosine aminotransferase
MTNFQPASRLRGIQKSAIRQLFDRAKPGDINLGLGEPDLPTPDVIRREAARVALEEQNGYTTHAGLPALRERIASDYPHLAATADNVIVTAGSQEALYLALLTIVDEDDEVLLPNPGFVAYPTIVKMAGGTPKFYRLPAAQDFGFDADDFQRQVTEKTKAAVVISPSNPTGRVLSPADLQAMADALNGTNAIIISDEIYRSIYFGAAKPASPSEFYQNTVILSGLSKGMSMTGWRLGWMCGPAEMIQPSLVLHGYVTTCASTVSQKAALASWTYEAAEARQNIRRAFRQRRDYLHELIVNELRLRVALPDGAFYLMVETRRFGSSLEVAEKLLDNGVITVPGGAFGDESEGWLRVSYCADADKLAKGVQRIKSALTL